MAKTLREHSFTKVRTSNGRYRHIVITAVTDQDTIEGRIGLVGNSASVAAERQSSTTTRGTEFRQA